MRIPASFPDKDFAVETRVHVICCVVFAFQATFFDLNTCARTKHFPFPLSSVLNSEHFSVRWTEAARTALIRIRLGGCYQLNAEETYAPQLICNPARGCRYFVQLIVSLVRTISRHATWDLKLVGFDGFLFVAAETSSAAYFEEV